MEKKLILVLFMAALLAGETFAQISMSAGLGGTFTANFMNYAWTSDGKDYLNMLEKMSSAVPGMPAYYFKKDSSDSNIIGGGFFGYFDATYVILLLGMGFYDISPANSDMKKEMDDAKTKSSLTTFDIGLLLKYPISIGVMTLFPLLGGDVKIAVAEDYTVDGKKYTWKDRTNDDTLSEYMTSVWLKFGVGADIPLSEKLYLRTMFLYGFGTLPKITKESLDEMNNYIKMANIIYHGLDVKLAIGYKF